MLCKKVANTLYMPREKWLKIRKGGIGGSDIGAIIGVNPYASPFNVFIDKTSDYVKELSDNEAVYWGTTLEDIAAIENQIKQYMGKFETGQSQKYTVRWKTQNGAPKFDKEKLANEIGTEFLGTFYTPTTVRKFSIKENK